MLKNITCTVLFNEKKIHGLQRNNEMSYITLSTNPSDLNLLTTSIRSIKYDASQEQLEKKNECIYLIFSTNIANLKATTSSC